MSPPERGLCLQVRTAGGDAGAGRERALARELARLGNGAVGTGTDVLAVAAAPPGARRGSHMTAG